MRLRRSFHHRSPKRLGRLFFVLPIVVLLGLVVDAPPKNVRGELSPPNVVVVLTDDQRAGGFYRLMPRTKALFKDEGIRFSKAYATTPVCCPSRASIFTGRYAHNHNVRRNRDGDRMDQSTTIQRYLRDAGYRTAIAGKYLNKWDVSDDPPHFDRWAIMLQGYEDITFNIDGSMREVPGHSTPFIADYAASLVSDFEQDDDRPWFMFLSPYPPHLPAIAEAPYEDLAVGTWRGNAAVRERDQSDKPAYVHDHSATISDGRAMRRKQLRTLPSVDDLVDRVFSALAEHGELENTVAVFLSDNGFMWGEHGLMGKVWPYRSSVRIPLLLRVPGHPGAGTVDDRLAANIDVAPTIAELAGVTAAVPMDGRSLLEDNPRKRLLREGWGGPRLGRWASLVTRDYTYTEYRPRNDWKIRFREYYTAEDPWELVNVFRDGDPTNDPARKPLREALADLRHCEGTSGPSACP